MNGLKNLHNLFNKKFYRISDYQRGYAQDKNQLEDFWEDLENSKDSKHYTGVLSLKSISGNEKKRDHSGQKIKQYEKKILIIQSMDSKGLP